MPVPFPVQRLNDITRAPKKKCDRCDKYYYEDELTLQAGVWVCDLCYDIENDKPVMRTSP